MQNRNQKQMIVLHGRDECNRGPGSGNPGIRLASAMRTIPVLLSWL
ncbi:MAG: hypothetical protein R3222_00635 [Balneolaceae bacterium]|nr:hypothetical protein [Balneolaceae bacterium]